MEVVGIGSGIGGRLRPVVENGKITDVKIVNAGIGYTVSPQIIVKPGFQLLEKYLISSEKSYT